MRFEDILRVAKELAARAEGIPYQVLVNEILNLALERAEPLPFLLLLFPSPTLRPAACSSLPRSFFTTTHVFA